MYENITVNMMMQGMSSQDIAGLLRSGLKAQDTNRIGPAIEALATRGDTDMIGTALFDMEEFDLTMAATTALSGCLVRLKKVDPVLGNIGKLLCRVQGKFLKGEWLKKRFRFSDINVALDLLTMVHPETLKYGTDAAVAKAILDLHGTRVSEKPTDEQVAVANILRHMIGQNSPVAFKLKEPEERTVGENLEGILGKCAESAKLAETLAKKYDID